MLLLAAVSASAQPAGNVAPAEATNWQADLAQLARHLEAAHGDAFHTISRSDFAEMVAALDRRIPELARNEIIVEMQRITAAVGDGHTAVQLFFDSDVGFHRLPIRLGWFDEGIFVEAVGPEAGLAPGARLLAIGGVGIDEAVRRVTPLISRDNDIWIRVVAPMLLASPEVLHAVGLAVDPASAVLTIERDGRTRNVALRARGTPFTMSHGSAGATPAGWIDARGPSAASTPALRRRNPGRAYWFEYVPEARVLYIQYNMVNDAPEGPGVHEFFRSALQVLDQQPVDRVVLDIRDNMGGEGGLNTEVVRMLVRRTELDRPGALVVIIGRRTFSAAQWLAHELDRWTAATFVGEPTGSSPQFWGDHRVVELENSRIDVSVSPTWHQPGGPYDRRDFLPPRLAFEPRFEDYLADRDPVMDAILGGALSGPDLAGPVTRALAAGDAAAADAAVREWSADPRHRYRSATAELNRIGYSLLADERASEALAVLRLNVELHPDYANGWDSLGEALLREGCHDDALAAYRRAFELDPEVGNAARVLGEAPAGH